MNAKIDVTDVILYSDRLILRPWQYSDLDDFFEYASVDGVGEMAGWEHHKNKKESLRILTHFIKNKRELAIVYKDNNKVIGSIGIKRYGLEDRLSEFFAYQGRELGYVLSKDYWNQGLMTEAVKTVINYLFNDLNLDFILCGYFDYNAQSKRVSEKCGFVPYRSLVFTTNMGKKEKGVLTLLSNPNKDITYRFSYKSSLLIK